MSKHTVNRRPAVRARADSLTAFRVTEPERLGAARIRGGVPLEQGSAVKEGGRGEEGSWHREPIIPRRRRGWDCGRILSEALQPAWTDSGADSAQPPAVTQ